MTRGRKKDLTITPTRALVQQRDYRARKAHYVAELEARCRSAEHENARLREELAIARAGVTPPAINFSPQIAAASADLIQHLSQASSSLGRFQRLAFSELQAPSSSSIIAQSPDNSSLNVLRPASFPSPAPSPPFSTSAIVSEASHAYYAGRKRLHREDSPQPPALSTSYANLAPSPTSRSSSVGSSECCGGILDCRELCGESVASPSMTGMSGLRTTSEDNSPSPSHSPSDAVR